VLRLIYSRGVGHTKQGSVVEDLATAGGPSAAVTQPLRLVAFAYSAPQADVAVTDARRAAAVLAGHVSWWTRSLQVGRGVWGGGALSSRREPPSTILTFCKCLCPRRGRVQRPPFSGDAQLPLPFPSPIVRDPRKLAAYRKRYPLTDFIDLARTPRANAAANPASVLAQDPLALVRDYMFEAHGDRGCPLVLLLSFADLLADGDWVDRLLRYVQANAWRVWFGHALM